MMVYRSVENDAGWAGTLHSAQDDAASRLGPPLSQYRSGNIMHKPCRNSPTAACIWPQPLALVWKRSALVKTSSLNLWTRSRSLTCLTHVHPLILAQDSKRTLKMERNQLLPGTRLLSDGDRTFKPCRASALQA
ncbi:hypothetical protein NMY22_g10516 [Coprinellus aureogranulatus]|nr:hypothetical protein NMY22_g10516 [Coprinellus aureogranulatus]